MITIYHNNRCSTSRCALEILEEKGKKFNTVEYLKDVPTVDELKGLIKKLKIKPFDLIRTKEPLFIEKYKGKNLSDEEWIKVMHENPILIQRPIIINGNKAVIGRPPEKVLEIL